MAYSEMLNYLYRTIDTERPLREQFVLDLAELAEALRSEGMRLEEVQERLRDELRADLDFCNDSKVACKNVRTSLVAMLAIEGIDASKVNDESLPSLVVPVNSNAKPTCYVYRDAILQAQEALRHLSVNDFRIGDMVTVVCGDHQGIIGAVTRVLSDMRPEMIEIATLESAEIGLRRVGKVCKATEKSVTICVQTSSLEHFSGELLCICEETQNLRLNEGNSKQKPRVADSLS